MFEREGVAKHIVKNRSTIFCIIYYSIWPNQFPTTCEKGLCVFQSVPPSERNRDNREYKSRSLEFHDFCQKFQGRKGGQHDQHYVKNKFVKNRVGGRGVNLNLDNVFKYTVFFLDVTPKGYLTQYWAQFLKENGPLPTARFGIKLQMKQ